MNLILSLKRKKKTVNYCKAKMEKKPIIILGIVKIGLMLNFLQYITNKSLMTF